MVNYKITTEAKFSGKGRPSKDAVPERHTYKIEILGIASDFDAVCKTVLDLASGLGVSLDTLLKGLDSPGRKKNRLVNQSENRLFIGILSIDNRRITCIKNEEGRVIGTSQLARGLDLVESNSSLLKQIHESVQEALGQKSPYASAVKDASLNLVMQSYEFEETKTKFLQFARRQFKKVSILSDWQITYLAAFGGQELGISLIVDKGVSLSYSQENEIRKIGGWKFPVYDLGGENWLGAEAVKHTIEAVEGLVPMSELARNILSKFTGGINALTEACLTSSNDADIFCLFAEPLIRLYLTGDETANHIMSQGCQHVKRLIDRADALTKSSRKIVVNGSLADIYLPLLDEKNTRLISSKNNTEKACLLANLDYNPSPHDQIDV